MVMGPNGTLVPRELGVDFGVENYETYEEAIDALSEQQTAAEKQTIEVNWNIGRQAWIVSAGAKYGSHSIEEFAKDLDMSMSSVYTARNFYSKYSLDAVHRLIDNNLSYRKIVMLLGCNDELERDKLEDALKEFRIGEEPLKLMVAAANEGVVMPEDPAGMRAYVDMCKEGTKPGVDEEAEDDDEEEEEETVPTDPVEKIRAQMQTSCDELSLAISALDQKVSAFSNFLKGDLWGSIDAETKASFNGMLSGLATEISDSSRKTWQLQRMLPAPATKEADK